MKTKKILWTVLGLIGGVVLLPYIIVILFYTIHGLVILISPPPAVSVKYAEFPFEITYEINGEVKTVNDIFVCKYDGVGMNEGVGKYIKWKGYVKSTGEEDILLIEDGNISMFCSIGSPEYYMGDPSYFIDGIARPDYRITPSIYYIEYPNEFGGETIGIAENEHLEKYKIKLISWKLSDPIVNSFK